MLSHSVVLTLTTFQGERIARCSMTIALTFSTDPFVDDVLQASVPITASLTREPGVTWGARTFLNCTRPGQAERSLCTKFHCCCVQGAFKLIGVVLGPDQQPLQPSQALHELMLAHPPTARHMVPGVLQEDQLDGGVLTPAIIRITKAHAESCSFDDNIWLLCWSSRCVSSSSVPRSCHSHTLSIGDKPVPNIGRGSLPIVRVQTNVLLGDGQTTRDAAPVRRHPYSATDVGDVPTRLMVEHLNAKTCRVTGAGDSVAEALSTSLRVRREQRKVAGLTSVTAGTSCVLLAHTLPVTLATSCACKGARAGCAGGEVHEPDGALVALGTGEAWTAYTVTCSKTTVGQFVILKMV